MAWKKYSHFLIATTCFKYTATKQQVDWAARSQFRSISFKQAPRVKCLLAWQTYPLTRTHFTAKTHIITNAIAHTQCMFANKYHIVEEMFFICWSTHTAQQFLSFFPSVLGKSSSIQTYNIQHKRAMSSALPPPAPPRAYGLAIIFPFRASLLQREGL